jgi:hypothetical protein
LALLRQLVGALLWLLGSKQPVWAQREATNWYFGDQAGFSFQAGAPRPLFDGQMSTSYASTVLSDPITGQLLLYSNGEQVWGRDHRVMPNGSTLVGSSYVTQGTLLVPLPDDPSRYYLFTLKAWGATGTSPQPVAASAGRLAYSVVDLRLNQGLGDVVAQTKNRVVATGLNEKLTAVRHANGRDYWVICHEWQSNVFLVAAVRAAGIGPFTRYAVGPAQPVDTLNIAFQDQARGVLQASPDGRKLAYGVLTGGSSVLPTFGLYDFDPATGAVTNFVNLGPLRDAYAPCFSPDNSKLYVPNFGRTPDGQRYNIISQYDLQAGDEAAIAASGQSIIIGNPATNINPAGGGDVLYQLQNGPDGRLYGASGYRSAGPDEQPGDDRNVFFVVNRPNARGFACDVQYQRFDFGGRYGNPGLPNFMQHYFDGLEPVPVAACALAELGLFPNPTTDAFQIRLPVTCFQPYTLTVCDALGRKVLKHTILTPANQHPINVTTLAAGLYVVEVRFAQQVVVKKLLKW